MNPGACQGQGHRKRKTMRPKVQIISAALFSGAVCDTVPEAHLTMEGDDPTLMCLYFLFRRRALEALSGCVPDSGKHSGC